MEKLKRLFGYKSLDESGFTLIEMLIVVGIIVALAAAIVPQVIKFGGEGAEGKKSAEVAAVQVAMDAMMADVGISTVTVSASSTSNFAVNPTGTGAVGLATGTSPYLRTSTTIYYYCWDTNGKISQKGLVADTSSGSC